MAAKKIPATFTFNFLAIDGWAYPVTVAFDARLSCTTFVGINGSFELAFRNRAASTAFHTVHPRCRVVITVDTSSVEKSPGTYSESELNQWKAFRASGANLADQLFIALQARRF